MTFVDKKLSVKEELNLQRDESDARSIIHEVEGINNLEGEQRYRWIWELIQNAKDEAGQGVDIECILHETLFQFCHNGRPFENKNLLALLRKTSTKSLSGTEGNTGKFGTGFVTTHLLNKKAIIEGVHQNEEGLRKFNFTLDRTPTSLEGMKTNISLGIEEIEKIDSVTAERGIPLHHTFKYDLNTDTYPLAKGGVEQLRRNLCFALLINKKINSLTLTIENEKTIYKITRTENLLDGISYIELQDNEQLLTPIGLLYYETENTTIGIPATQDPELSLEPFKGEARLFKDLPLIGTEKLYLPVIFQNRNFLPTEHRDGVRTKIISSEDPDSDQLAKTNQEAFSDLVKIFPAFLQSLLRHGVKNTHLIAESGLPENIKNYGEHWYPENVQRPLRESLLKYNLVETVSGEKISISEAKFIQCESHQEKFYSLISRWFPNQCPNESTYQDWNRIISQEPENWPDGITINLQQIIEIVVQKANLSNFPMPAEESGNWLQDLITFIEETEFPALDRAIFPNQLGELKIQDEVFHDCEVDPRFKTISKGLGRDLKKELLPEDFAAKHVKLFDEKDFLLKLNSKIGNLPVRQASEEEIEAIIDICCSFRDTKAERRLQWFSIIQELLPELAKEKVQVNIDDYQFEPAEKWCLKYVCYLIENAVSLEELSGTYFKSNRENALEWLDKLFSYVFRNDDNQSAALVYKIIPTQDGFFKKYSEEIYRENEPLFFSDDLKKLYLEYTGKGNPQAFLVDQLIHCTSLRQAPKEKLTSAIDKIFADRRTEDMVKPGQRFHKLFLRLKDWTDQYPEKEGQFFPHFGSIKALLYVKAFGGQTFSRLLKLKRSVDDIEILDGLKLETQELKKLDEAVALLGNSAQLLQKANEMIQEAEMNQWRKKVGKAAENAFCEAIAEIEVLFDQENPDVGKDFVIKYGDKEFSVELKSAVEGKETVKMSLLQGEHAAREKDHYALGIISRPSGTITTKEFFIENARFVTDIGEKIGDKVQLWKEGVENLEVDGEVKIELDNKSGSLNIKKEVWVDNKNFHEFVKHLREYFGITNNDQGSLQTKEPYN